MLSASVSHYVIRAAAGVSWTWNPSCGLEGRRLIIQVLSQ